MSRHKKFGIVRNPKYGGPFDPPVERKEQRQRNSQKKEQTNMTIIRELKQLNLEGQLEDLVFYAASAKTARAEFEARNIPVPEWLDDAIRQLTTAIDNQTRDAKLLKLRELQTQRQSFLSREEKRQATEQEIARLEAELAGKV